MTEEEMAEEYIKANNLEWELECNRASPIGEVMQAFLTGLKAGRPKWHDLRKDPNDLPKDENDVLVYSGEDWRMCVGKYFPKYKAWEAGCDTIAWCEIPKFEDKENE